MGKPQPVQSEDRKDEEKTQHPQPDHAGQRGQNLLLKAGEWNASGFWFPRHMEQGIHAAEFVRLPDATGPDRTLPLRGMVRRSLPHELRFDSRRDDAGLEPAIE